MCGILGIASSKNKEKFQEQLNKIEHRGPDDKGVYYSEFLTLGHQRLSILDLSLNGHQPMISKDKRYVIVFNGEIYNHEVLRKPLEKKYEFKSNSDTETILYGYIEYNVELFNRLNGIFAFAIYDTQTKDLLLVRDQFGVKPLYYYKSEEQFLFSSELKAIVDEVETNKDINYKALVNYINFLWSPGEDTPLKEFKKLLPGHYLRINTKELKQFKIKKYYEIPFTGKYGKKTEKEWIDELDDLIQKAVERQLLSDVPIGFFLSGGLDSSLIVAVANKLRPNNNFNCYTIKTANQENFEGFENDLTYARKVASHLNINLWEVESEIDIVRDFDKMIWHLDEPQADAAPLHVLNICKLARRNGDIVLLGGTAGDDLFSGYRRHQILQFEAIFSVIPRPIGIVIKKIIHSLKGSSPTLRRIKKISRSLDLSSLNRMASYYEWIPLSINKSLFEKSIHSKIMEYDPNLYLINALNNISGEKNKLNQLLYWDMKYFLADHNLNYMDKLSMAVGVEVRVPFLDKELVEYSTKIPPTLKLKGKTTKYILKKVAERYLPHDVIYRPKSGFAAPIREWVKKDMDTLIQTKLSQTSLEAFKIFDYKKVKELIENNKKDKIDAAYTIWSILAIESWFKQFVSNN